MLHQRGITRSTPSPVPAPLRQQEIPSAAERCSLPSPCPAAARGRWENKTARRWAQSKLSLCRKVGSTRAGRATGLQKSPWQAAACSPATTKSQAATGATTSLSLCHLPKQPKARGEQLGSTSAAETSLSDGPVAARHSVRRRQPDTHAEVEPQHGDTSWKDPSWHHESCRRLRPFSAAAARRGLGHLNPTLPRAAPQAVPAPWDGSCSNAPFVNR